MSTVRRRLSEAGLYGRIIVKKLLLRKQNNVKKFQWAKVHKHWTIEQWDKVLQTEEINIWNLCEKGYVWRRIGEKVASHQP